MNTAITESTQTKVDAALAYLQGQLNLKQCTEHEELVGPFGHRVRSFSNGQFSLEVLTTGSGREVVRIMARNRNGTGVDSLSKFWGLLEIGFKPQRQWTGKNNTTARGWVYESKAKEASA